MFKGQETKIPHGGSNELGISRLQIMSKFGILTGESLTWSDR